MRASAPRSASQPRVPAGNRDGGQWADAPNIGRNDPRVLSDATPDPVRPGARYAMGRRVTVPRIIGGRVVEIEPGQAARFDAAEARAQDALRRVREIDPAWKIEPTAAAPQSVESAIARREADTRDAKARHDVLDRLGINPPGASVGAEVRSTADILAPGGNLIGVRERGAGDNIRTVPTEEFAQIRDQMLAGAVPVTTRREYNALRFDRPDGVRFGLRLSDDHGPTIDIGESNDPLIPQNLKVHRR